MRFFFLQDPEDKYIQGRHGIENHIVEHFWQNFHLKNRQDFGILNQLFTSSIE